MKKFFKVLIVVFLIAIVVVFATIGIFLLYPSNLELNEKLLIKSSDFINYYDTHNSLIEIKSNYFNSKNALNNENLVKAFVAGEDKNFFSHSGLDYPRMIKSTLVNIKNGEFSQGASTISQQLIKNTHLSQEKTIIRKLKEIKLTQKLEKTYSKEQILEMYFDTIYFGENVYGVENAARYYFSKSAEDLTLSECATLAGIVPSPARYNPIADKTLAKKRRDLVLKRMLDNKTIDKAVYDATIKEDITLDVSKKDDVSAPYINACMNEIYALTDFSPYELTDVNVYTYYDGAVQTLCNDSFPENDFDYQSIVIDNETRGIAAYYSTCGEIKRSPASTIKPLLVYAPSIDSGVIYPMTKIKDEPAIIDGYSPKNYLDRYCGDVSASYALSNSLNVPAVKLLNATGIEKCKNYLNKLGIDDSNDALNIALGNFNEGVSLKSLAGAYTVFSNYGRYSPTSFVRKITDKSGKTLYEREKSEETVFSEGTATVINQMLSDCVKTGTAKKLAGKPYDLCAKTGTQGNEDGNTDAYIVAYTSDKTLACWCGNTDSSKMPNSVTGGSTPAFCADYILNGLYDGKKPAPLDEKGVKKLYIDKRSYEKNGEFLLASEKTKEKDKLRFTFTNEHYPKTKAKDMEKPKLFDFGVSVFGDTVIIPLFAEDGVLVEIRKTEGKTETVVYDGPPVTFSDTVGGDAVYNITPYILSDGERIYGDSIEKKIKKNRKKTGATPDFWWLD